MCPSYTQKDRRTDGQMDRRTDGTENITSTAYAGGKNRPLVILKNPN